MELIDTHCHLDSAYKDDTLDEQIKHALQNEVRGIIAIGTHIEDWEVNQLLAKKYPQVVSYTVGLHPCYVKNENISHTKILKHFFEKKTPPLALGECGLDYYHLSTDPQDAQSQKQLQRIVFADQLALAKQLDCPIVIHSRYALEDTLSMLYASGIKSEKVIFHCFSEGPDSIKKILDKGYRASFTGIITYKGAHEVRSAALTQGLDLLMIETDAPWLSPVPMRGKPNTPAYLRYIAEYAADLFKTDIATLAHITSTNARSFFGIKEQ